MKKKGPLWKSFYHALCGIKEVFHHERNFKIHVLILSLVIISGMILKISLIEWLICLVLFGLVLSLELINTAIEATVDICMPEQNPKAKLAKDTAAGGVLIGAIISSIVGLIIFLPKGIEFINNFIK